LYLKVLGWNVSYCRAVELTLDLFFASSKAGKLANIKMDLLANVGKGYH
jgi:hypothetical protein